MHLFDLPNDILTQIAEYLYDDNPMSNFPTICSRTRQLWRQCHRLYHETAEHKEEYENNPKYREITDCFSKCIHLLSKYNKGFYYETHLPFSPSECNEWIIKIPREDWLMSISLGDHNQMKKVKQWNLCTSGIYTKSTCLMQSNPDKPWNINIPRYGIPLIPLYYYDLTLHVIFHDNIMPKDAHFIFNILPNHQRKNAALSNHTIFISENTFLEISGGKMHKRSVN